MIHSPKIMVDLKYIELSVFLRFKLFDCLTNTMTKFVEWWGTSRWVQSCARRSCSASPNCARSRAFSNLLARSTRKQATKRKRWKLSCSPTTLRRSSSLPALHGKRMCSLYFQLPWFRQRLSEFSVWSFWENHALVSLLSRFVENHISSAALRIPVHSL